MGLPERLPFRLNARVLAGLSRAVGIEFGEHEIRAVEVERTGLINRTGSAQTKLLWSYTLRVEWDSAPEEIASKLGYLFEAMSTNTRRAALCLRPQALRLVRAEVPDGVHSIPEWIEDNFGKLLQLPIPLSELSYDYRSLARGHHEGQSVEIAFVRRVEVEKCMEICRSAALESLFLGAATESSKSSADIGVSPEYATAFHLASSVLFSHQESCDFLPRDARGEAEQNFYRRLTKRVGLSAAVVLLVVLLAEFLASMYIDSRESTLDESSASNKATVSELATLEKNVKALEDRLAAVRYGTDRTELARAMHDVASVPAPGVRFHRLGIVEKKSGDLAFTVTGEIPSHEQLARFLAALDTASFCQNVTLLKSGSGSESGTFQRNTHPGSIPFDLEGRIR